jgi:predicted amidophosphoribosyltransferase
MKCPHCSQQIGGHNCPSCNAEVLEEGLFCHRCGLKLEKGESLPKTSEKEEDMDFSQRILCSDGTCIGVVNDQGFCKVCGKPYTGNPK